MADSEIKPSTDGSREELVAKQLASTKIHLALTQERVDVPTPSSSRSSEFPNSAWRSPRSLDVSHRHQHGERAYAAPADR